MLTVINDSGKGSGVCRHINNLRTNTMATVQQQTTQLEFHQAMADFKTMFPAMDDDVIEAVLRSNQGAVDATIDQLLAMSTDNENEKIRLEIEQEEPSPGSAHPPTAVAQPAKTITMTPGAHIRCTGASAVRPDVMDSAEVGTKPLRHLRGWAPALLGPLPDDFLRITIDPLPPKQTEGELEDERIAMLLQNEEFMAELRWNKDFLSMLENDSPPEERIANFPMSRTGDDDAIFKERLRNMGKLSRKKFAQLARVFTGRKKRSSAKAILSHGPASSRDNFLLQEEDSDGP